MLFEAFYKYFRALFAFNVFFALEHFKLLAFKCSLKLYTGFLAPVNFENFF